MTPAGRFSRELTVERVVPGGEGLGRVEGVVALVEGGLPGDRVLAELAPEGPGLFRGRAAAILSAGPHRRPPGEVCARAAEGSCGGCDWPAVREGSARELKTELVLDALRRVGGLPGAELPPPAFVPSPPNYRLRNRLHLGADGRLGFFAPRSNRVASDLAACEIVSGFLLGRLPAVRGWLRELGMVAGELATLENREGSLLLGELRLAPGFRPGPGPPPAHGPFDGFRLLDAGGRVLFEEGPASVELATARATFRVSVSSFFQGNRFLLDAFLDEVRTALDAALRAAGAPAGPLRTLDLYAGVGFLTRPLLDAVAARGGETVAVEVDPSASRDLEANLRRWTADGLPAVRRALATAEAWLRPAPSPESRFLPDLVVADPPRAGLSPPVRRGLLSLRPHALVMVSCDPPTLARDLAALRGSYRIERLTLLDLFPGTHHVETVALLLPRT